ncbi:putative Polysaccharide biosynthesis protein [Nitrospira japonica]|uniref:Putative Polysaccharide biosynthesis protein n=1 Tax=Nitrospira japonica TaxID=1325564 RepID=A0A1W1IBE8_9BACT|nr:flippase [Nitrospira japonica]SLM50305.1 putative Polysaccharide biosynthesis protein [Nitrospira japonica]
MLTSLGKDVVLYGASDLLFKVLAFSVFPIYAYTFSVRDFGVIELVTAFSMLLTICCSLGLNNAVQRYYWDSDLTEEGKRRLVSTGLLFQSGSTIAVVAAAAICLYAVRQPIEEQYGMSWPLILFALAGLVPSVALQYVLDVLRLQFVPWRYACVAFLKNAVGVGAGLVLILAFGFGVTGIFMGTAVAGLLAVPVGLWLIGKDLEFDFNSGVAQTLFQFGYPFIFSGLAYWALGSIDRWMIAQFSNMDEVGLYGIAFKFAAVVMFLNTAFGQAWSPWAMKVRADRPDYRKVYSEVFSIWFLLLTLAGCALSLFAKELLILTTPERYWPAANILIVAVLGVVFLGTTQITAVGISLEKRTRIFAVSAWVGAALNVALNLVLIPRLGALGAALATTVTYFALSGSYLYWTQRVHPLPLNWTQLLSVFVVGLLSVPVAWTLNGFDTGLRTVLVKVLVMIIPIFLMWRGGLFRETLAAIVPPTGTPVEK